MPHLRRTRLHASCLLVLAVVLTGGAASAWTAPLPPPPPATVDPAPVVASDDDDRSSQSERRGWRALDSLDYPWRGLGYTVEFRESTGGTLGTANSRTRRIVVYVKRSQTHQSLRVTIAHELGHALDFEHATAERRREYRTVRELDQSARWFPCDRCSDYDSHAGDWAEVFATWLAGPGDFRSRVAGPPTGEELRRLSPLFRLPRSTSATAAASPRATPTASASASPTPSPLVPDLPEGTPAAAEDDEASLLVSTVRPVATVLRLPGQTGVLRTPDPTAPRG